MRNDRWLVRAGLVAALAAGTAKAANPAGAAGADPGRRGLGTWTGTGVVFGLDGKSITTFTVTTKRTASDAQTVESKGVVKLANGDEKPLDEKTIFDGNHYRTESSR